MKIENLKQTCNACPSQWEFKTDGDRNAYVRYRLGTLSVRISKKPNGDAVRGIEILHLHLSDPLDGTIEWGKVEKLIKDIHIDNTLKSMANNVPLAGTKSLDTSEITPGQENAQEEIR